MDRASVTTGAAFKTAVRSTLIMLLVFVVFSVVAFYYLQRAMLDAIELQVTEDKIVLTQIYNEEGPTGLVEAISELRRPLGASLHAVGLFDASGQRLAGNIDIAPSLFGWSRQILALSTSKALAVPNLAASFYLNLSKLDDLTLVVGSNLALVQLQETRMIAALAGLGLALSACFLGLGYAISLKSLRKLKHMGDTLARVSHGETGIRLAISPENDQIDRVAQVMNVHLDRLSELMLATRASAAAIAHDLRTPLTRAYLQLDRAQAALDAGTDPRSQLDQVEGELIRLQSIFDAILRISRLESVADTSGFSQVALAPLLGELAETFGPLAEDNGQTLTLSSVAPDLCIYGDGPMLSQLIANLVQNAINHCPAGTAVSIGAKPETGAVRIWVSDTGPGIPESERKRVFEIFYRVDPNRTGQGNGLGMALVKAIADHLGAQITLSNAAPGLRVDIVFPMVP